MTSAHPRDDVRIFHKQCRSFAAHGYEVTLIVADNLGDELRDGVKIVDAGRLPGRLNRMFRTTGRVFEKAVALSADLYLLHDPELIPIGLRLKRMGKKVVFDSHEDVPKQMYSRPYLGPVSQRLLSAAFSLYERFACRRLDGILAATPFIRDKFLEINPRTLDVNNYPFVGELDAAVPWGEKREEVCYVGVITGTRGIREVVRACGCLGTNARLNLAGVFSEPDVEAEVKALPGWSRVSERGFLDRAGVRELLGRSLAGLVTFLPLPNHLDAQPNKMFEYMSAGIPVIASDFPLWRAIIQGNDCGLLVDPLDPKAIAGAIDRLVENPGLARRMGENGRAAVLEKYNWSTEEGKLLDFIAGILADRGGRP
ncbi:MAG: glycosyltransferase family 4 protein [Deltaproteobacteria bacterium]|nr:glycosyltransferase family 4 protein [Deltaproteobacteria bacterium]